MNHSDINAQNEAAFRRMKPEIDARYPPGHYVAFDGGVVVADAPSYWELEKALVAAGKDARHVFVVQAGVDYPEYAVILSLLWPV